MALDILAIGEPMLEFNSQQEGSLSEVDQFSVGFGGDTSNFTVAAARLGGRAAYFTVLGDDLFGDRFIAMWEKEGIDTSHVKRDTRGPTGIYFISRKTGQHSFTYYRKNSAAALMTPEDLPANALETCRALHVSGISQAISQSACDTVFSAINLAKAGRALVSYDPNLRLKLWPLERARAVIHETVKMANLFLPSYEDATVLTGKTDPKAIVEFYLNMGPDMVALKLGAHGALLGFWDRNKDPVFRKIDPFKVNPIDMTGAGDAFDGAFVVGTLSGMDPESCGRFANAAGALTTTGLGAVNPIPERADVERLMAGEHSLGAASAALPGA